MTYNYFDNDYKMSAFLTEKAVGIARAAKCHYIVGNPQPRRGNYGANNGGAAHHTGGATSWGPIRPPARSANRYLQCWEASNLFVMGGAASPAESRPRIPPADDRGS